MSTTTNWLPYYVLYMKQQQRARQAVKEKQEIEQKLQEVQETTDEEVKDEVKETQQTESKNEDIQEESKDVLENTPTKETVKSIAKVKLDDCDAIYEMSTTEYALCELTKAQEQQSNMMIALTFVTCIVLAGVIVVVIVQCINRSVDREYERRKKNGGSGFTII